MHGLLRRHRLSLLCLCAAGLIALAAVVDHRNKAARMNRAEVAEWYCAHQGTRCGGPSSDRIEAHWNARQQGYEIAVAALGGVALAGVAYRLLRG